MFTKIMYFLEPSPVMEVHFPRQSWRGVAFHCLRWRRAMNEYGYMGIGNCNALADHFYWHDAASFTYNSRGWKLNR